ncbi:MAG: response regulator [Rhodospirillaceae bacterium]|nr:response regulator [Rhodospirillaceae bacterium]MBT5375145.1 response regulator [Rhodospirillaceae bacterium]MBT5752547.1 response regulator [Rhodospirillaceae bacterium]
MENYNFESSYVVLGEPKDPVRGIHKGILARHGFKHILSTGEYQPIEDAVIKGEADLLICDVDMPGGDFCDLVYRIRHGEIGKNPFLMIFATTARPSQEMVARVVDSGVDDLIIKPVSLDTIFERIVNLTDDRKQFEVTSDYVGPDRRNKSRRNKQSLALVDVPNTLKLKAEGKISSKELQSMIDAATNKINDQKLEQHSVQVSWLVNQLLPLYEAGEIDDKLLKHLDNLLFISRDIGRRLALGDYDHVAEICHSLHDVAVSVREKYEKPNPKDLKLLEKLSQAVEGGFKLDRSKTGIARDISQTISQRHG